MAFGRAVDDVFSTLTAAGYSKDQELEADKGALQLLQKAGYRASGLTEVLNSLTEVKNGAGGWFATHPSAKDRLDSISGLVVDSSTSQTGSSIRAARFIKNSK